MGMWPFSRRNNSRHSTGGAAITPSEMHDAGSQRDPGRHNGTEIASAGPERRRSRRDKKRKSSRDSKKLQRNPDNRTYSFSPGRNDSIRVARDTNQPPVPPIPSTLTNKGVRSNTEKPVPVSDGQRPQRSSTQPADDTQEWQRMPTLTKRSAQDLARRKSSKKRKEDKDRAAEIKAMAAYMPTRPAVDVTSSGRPMKRDSKRVREGLIKQSLERSSDISLPLAESIHSSLSSGSGNQTSYKLSALLAPRPTIKYSENPRYVRGASGYGSERSESKKRRKSERMSIPEVALKAHKRIDDLADDLDAGELRELMERDAKRTERKKLADRVRAEQKLARRQEKQKADEAIAAREGTPPPPNMERGVLGRDVVGLGIGTSAVITSNKRRGSIGSERRGKRSDSIRQDSMGGGQPPFGTFHRTASLQTEDYEATPTSEKSDPVIQTAALATVAKANVSPPASPRGHRRGQSSISQMLELNNSEATPDPVVTTISPAPRRATENTKTPQSWTSFFKRSAKNKRGSAPSSFSNTSRDSMNSGQGPLIGYSPMRSTSNIPKRTMSKFREDLPELPISPPDSRVQSPEADVVPPIRTGFSDKHAGTQGPVEDSRVRYDTPTSGYRSLDAMRLRDETPTSGNIPENAPSPEPVALSQSLASIDSEGSWLSGRRSKRGSAQLPLHTLRDSGSSLNQRYKEPSESSEELGIAEDEYFSRLSPGPEEDYKMHRASTGKPMESSDEEDGGSIGSPVSGQTKWGAVARTPTVVHREPRAKSREGLLNEFEDGSESMVGTPEKANRKSYGFNKDLTQDSGLQRARSVDLGRNHVRHISAGSARLLDVKPRASGESKRLSSG